MRVLPLAVAVVAILALGAIAGPLSGPILDEGVRVELVDVVQLPATSASLPRTRINGLALAPDGTGRVFVNDLRGPLYCWSGASVTLWLDLAVAFPSLSTAPGLATGFVSFAFHPDFATNGRFYTVHTEVAGATPPNLWPALPTAIAQHSVLSEFQASDPGAAVFSGTHRELMRVAAPHRFHNLGEIGFDPSQAPGDPEYGLLYVGAGDFGSVASGQPGQLQRLDTVLGTILRIDPLAGPFWRGGFFYDYGIPAGNPFASDADPATWGEIYAYGVRNAHRLVWDPAGEGTLFVTDVGEENLEEIDLVSPGRNFGWPLREGTFALDPSIDPGVVFALPPGDAGSVYPAAQYDHAEGRAIAGGVIARGAGVPALEGRFVTGDIVEGRLFYADVAALESADDGDPATLAPLHRLHLERAGEPATLQGVVDAALGSPGISRVDLRLARGPGGEVLVLTKQDGYVRRIATAPSAVPAMPLPLAVVVALCLVAVAAVARWRVPNPRFAVSARSQAK